MNGNHLIDLPIKRVTFSKHITGMEVRHNKKLPKDFFETILNLENEVVRSKSIESIQKLVDLYKFGVEFYSGNSAVKQQYFMEKLKEILMNKKILKAFEESKKEKVCIFTPISTLESENADENETRVSKTRDSKIRNRRFSGKVTKSDKKKNYLKERNSLQSRLSSIFISPYYVNQKRFSVQVDDNLKVSIKEMLEEQNRLWYDMYRKIDEAITNQKAVFQKKLKIYKQNKLMNNAQKSFSLSRKQMLLNNPLARKGKEKMRSSESLPNMSKKKFFERILLQRKIGFKTIPISKVFDNYFKKFHHIFNEEVFNQCFQGANNIVSKSFDQLIDNYNKAEDSVEDFRLTFQENDLIAIYQRSIELMVQNTYLEKEKNDMEIRAKTNRLLYSFYRGQNIDRIKGNPSLEMIIEELISDLYKLFK